MNRWLATNLISISLLTNGFALATSVNTANNPKTIPELLLVQNQKQQLKLDELNRLRDKAMEAEDNGLYYKATQILENILSIEKQTGAKDIDIAFTLNHLGVLYNHQGLYNKAELLFLQALEINEKALGPEHRDTAANLGNLGQLYSDQGLYNKAEPLLLQSLKINEKVLGPEHVHTATALGNLGNYFVRLNLLSKAEPLLLRALEINEKVLGPKHQETSTSANNLAIVYLTQQRFKKAEPLLLQALKINEKVLGPEHPATAHRLINLAALHNELGNYKKAEPLLLRALAINEKRLEPEHDEIAWLINNLAFSYSNQMRYKKAEELYRRALTISKKVYGLIHPETIIARNNLAVVYANQNDYNNAKRILRESLKSHLTLIQQKAPFLIINERNPFVRSFDPEYMQTFSSSVWGDSKRRLALLARLNRQGLLEEIEKRQSQLSFLAGPQQEVAQKLRDITQLLSSKELTPAERKALRAQGENLEKKLYRLLPEMQPRIIEIEQVANAIPRDGILLEYQRYFPFNPRKATKDNRWEEARYLALTLNSKGKIEAIDLGLAQPIEDKIQQALTASESLPEFATDLKNAQDLWREVGELVVKPLKESIGDAETLFISPDAELNRIPFAALSSHKDDQLLSDVVDIRLLTTGRELLDLAKESKSTKQKPLVVANPAFNLIKDFPRKQQSELIASNTSQQRSRDLRNKSWSPLKGTAKEGKAIAELTNAQLLTKNKATALAVQQQEAPKVLHIASHAEFLADQEKGENPLLRSYIVLAGANEPEANPKDDGYLTALEVTKLDWQGTELVVVSGCESGKGDIQSGEGVYGLKRAIAVAGARSSLLSLWKVDDRATAAFMTSFYKKLKAGEGRADALAATQKEFRNHPYDAMYRHPFVWAAFQLSGDWRPIQW